MGGLSGLLAFSRGLAYFSVGGSCCLPELATGEPEVFRRAGWVRAASPRQADLLLVTGPINAKLAPVVRRVHAQLSPPRQVVLVGSCAQATYARADAGDALDGAIRVEGCPAAAASVVRAVAGAR